MMVPPRLIASRGENVGGSGAAAPASSFAWSRMAFAVFSTALAHVNAAAVTN